SFQLTESHSVSYHQLGPDCRISNLAGISQRVRGAFCNRSRGARAPVGSRAAVRPSGTEGPQHFQYPTTCCAAVHCGFVPCMDGARGAREKNLTFPRSVRVQPCIRPLNAAVVAAGPDVIRWSVPTTSTRSFLA